MIQNIKDQILQRQGVWRYTNKMTPTYRSDENSNNHTYKNFLTGTTNTHEYEPCLQCF